MKRFLLFLLAAALLLGGCFPGTSLTRDGAGYQLAFQNPEERPAQFAAVVLGEPAEVSDPRCDVYEDEHEASAVNGFTCDLGVLEPGQAIPPIRAEGRRLSCEVYRLPILKIYPCAIRE